MADKIICSENPRHKMFLTKVKVVQEWLVNEHGDAVAVVDDRVDVITSDNPKYICDICGADAIILGKNSGSET